MSHDNGGFVLCALDVHYSDDAPSRAAALWFQTWTAENAEREVVIETAPAAPYVSGSFFLRELPALLEVLAKTPAVELSSTIVVVDGYVSLGDRDGLGAHLVRSLTEAGTAPLAVVGVAKNPFRSAPAVAVLRGVSTRPLFVTAWGMAPEVAAEHVASMSGPHRFPKLLQQVDALSRGRGTE